VGYVSTKINFSLTLTVTKSVFFRTPTNLYLEWAVLGSCDDNKIKSLINFDFYWFSLTLYSDKYTSQFSQYAFSTKLNCEVGILGFKRRQQSRVFDRILQILVQLCFGLRRVNLEIFAGCHSSEH
ncbi:uncharacterized protein V1477_020528, partial [Vespula maculifrons]